jgi:hypothetical protein
MRAIVQEVAPENSWGFRGGRLTWKTSSRPGFWSSPRGGPASSSCLKERTRPKRNTKRERTSKRLILCIILLSGCRCCRLNFRCNRLSLKPSSLKWMCRHQLSQIFPTKIVLFYVNKYLSNYLRGVNQAPRSTDPGPLITYLTQNRTFLPALRWYARMKR